MLPGLAAAVLVACGGAGDAGVGVQVDVQLGREAQSFTLRCDPPGGTVPNPAGACAELSANPAMLAPPPAYATCAGGEGIPPEVHVEGTVDGRRIEFAVRGCDAPAKRVEIVHRWLRVLGIEWVPA
jgi:hypothetical protein